MLVPPRRATVFVPVSNRLRANVRQSLTPALLALALLALAPAAARAGGQIIYYVDQGPLKASVSNQQATAMVDAAAALWPAVPTAGVALPDKGPLNEDVNGANILVNSPGQIAQPSDVTPAALP